MVERLPDSYRGPGVRVRFSRVSGETAKGLLKEPLYLPVLIDDLSETEDFGITDYDTIDAGEFSAADSLSKLARKLRTTDLQTLTIDWHLYARWLTAPQTTPAQAKSVLAALGRSKTPFQLLATTSLAAGAASEIRWKATLRSITRSLRAGEADTRYYDLQLKEWRDSSSRALGKGSGKGKGGKSLPTTAKITKKTTLTSLAKHFYGGNVSIALGVASIAGANGLTRWGSKSPIHNAKGWKVGKTIKIPKAMTAVDGPRAPVNPFTGLNR